MVPTHTIVEMLELYEQPTPTKKCLESFSSLIVPPWISPVVPTPIYESPEVQVSWDIPVFAVSERVRQKRVDARFIDHEKKRVLAVEMSCPWTENREKKQEEKTTKYGPCAGSSISSSQDMTFGGITSS